jgi:hypothetical protein
MRVSGGLKTFMKAQHMAWALLPRWSCHSEMLFFHSLRPATFGTHTSAPAAILSARALPSTHSSQTARPVIWPVLVQRQANREVTHHGARGKNRESLFLHMTEALNKTHLVLV